MIGRARHDEEAGGVVGVILDLRGDHVEAIDLRGEFGGEGCLRAVAGLGHLAGGAGVVGGDLALDVVGAQKARALRQDDDMAVGFGDVVQFRAGNAKEVDVDAHESLAHDVEAGLRQERVNVGDAAVGGIFHREQPEIDLAARDLVDDILECSRYFNLIFLRQR